jgi:hypothetical protein
VGADLLTIIPSRGRPTVVPVLAQTFRDTCVTDWQLVFAVDENDPDLPLYAHAVRAEPRVDLFINKGTPTMVGALNAAAAHYLPSYPQAIAFLGDDHRPRTVGWDAAYLETLAINGIGFVYGNDLLQGEKIPTQIAMSPRIPRELGHMAPDVLTHLFVDNYWLDLGRGAGCITYLPGVIVEHVHPFAGKAQLDEGYHRVNAPSMYQRDAATYVVYADRDLLADIEAVKEMRA